MQRVGAPNYHVVQGSTVVKLQAKVLAVLLDGMRERGTKNDSITFGNILLGQVLS